LNGSGIVPLTVPGCRDLDEAFPAMSDDRWQWHIDDRFISALREAGAADAEGLCLKRFRTFWQQDGWEVRGFVSEASPIRVWLVGLRCGRLERLSAWLLRPSGVPSTLERVYRLLSLLPVGLPSVAGSAVQRRGGRLHRRWTILVEDWRDDRYGVCEALILYSDRPGLRRQVLRLLGTVVGEAHRLGLRLPVRPLEGLCVRMPRGVGQGPSLSLSYLAGWRLDRSKPSRFEDLCRLAWQLQGCGLSRTDWVRLAEAYLGYMPVDRQKRRETLRRLVRRLRRRSVSAAGRIATDLGGRDMIKAGRAFVNRDYATVLMQLGFRNPRDAISAEIGERLDKPGLAGWRERRRVVLGGFWQDRRVIYLKRYRRPPAKVQLSRILRGTALHSTAWIELRNAVLLELHGLPAAKPVCFFEVMAGPVEVASLVAFGALPGESLECWLPENWGSTCARFGWLWRKEAIRRLAELVRRFHQRGLCHRDMYTSHIFVQVQPDGRMNFWFIDLQRVFAPKFARGRWVVKDLAALAASAPAELITAGDRMRFLLHYLGKRRLDDEAKRLWRRVAAKAARMLRHHAKRMRRLGCNPPSLDKSRVQ